MSQPLTQSSRQLKERDDRRNLKLAADNTMWLAIQALIQKTKREDDNNLGKENSENKIQIEICSEEIDRIFQLRKRGAPVNSGLMLHRALQHRCNKIVVAALLLNGADINKKDAKGCTPLHVAAFSNSDLIPFLIQKGADGTIKNRHGATALSICEKQWSEFVDGFREDRISLTSNYTEKHLANINSLMPASQKKRLLREGWMSPRMCHMLLHYAEMGVDAFFDGCGDLSYIPSSLAGQMKKSSFVDGYTECLERAKELLRRGYAPTVERIEGSLSSSALNHYIEKGGRVEHALDFMLKSIIYDEYGPWHMDSEDVDEDFEALPKTPLDDAVEVAKVMCIDLGGGELDEDGGGPYASRYQRDLYDEDGYDECW